MNIRLDSKFDHAWQWDMGHRLILEGAAPGVEVHYANSLSENALITVAYAAGEQVVAAVPNILLLEALCISVYVYAGQTMHTACIGVVARAKPDGYIYTPTEIKSWEQLNTRIDVLERMDPESVTRAADRAERAAEQARQAAQNIASKADGMKIDPETGELILTAGEREIDRVQIPQGGEGVGFASWGYDVESK